MMEENKVEQQAEASSKNGKTLDYYVERRNGNKKNYVFDYGESKTCPHKTMKQIMGGWNWYRCEDCNYAFFIMTAWQAPLHNVALEGAFAMMHFAKEFGMDSLGEVLRRPIGQADGTAQKPALPEGFDFMETLQLLEQIDVNAEDGGRAQLEALQDSTWVDEFNREKRRKELNETNAKENERQLEDKKQGKLSAVSVGEDTDSEDGSQGES
jgi:hypothetical protein